LKCHNLCAKYPPNTSVDSHISHPQHSVAVTLSRISGGRTQSGSWTKSCLCLGYSLSYIPPNNTRY